MMTICRGAIENAAEPIYCDEDYMKRNRCQLLCHSQVQLQLASCEQLLQINWQQNSALVDGLYRHAGSHAPTSDVSCRQCQDALDMLATLALLCVSNRLCHQHGYAQLQHHKCCSACLCLSVLTPSDRVDMQACPCICSCSAAALCCCSHTLT